MAEGAIKAILEAANKHGKDMAAFCIVAVLAFLTAQSLGVPAAVCLGSFLFVAYLIMQHALSRLRLREERERMMIASEERARDLLIKRATDIEKKALSVLDAKRKGK